jgi:hypothetical protein
MSQNFTFTREEAIREAAAILRLLNDRVQREGGVPVAEYQSTVQVAQAWATIGAAMQPGESLTAILPPVPTQETNP